MVKFEQDAATSYDDRIETLVPGYRAHLDAASSLLAATLAPRGDLLLVGVGTGNELPYLLDALPDWNFLACDPSQAMLDRAESRIAKHAAKERVQFQCCAVQDLRLGDKFDAAVSFLVAHFIPDDGSKSYYYRSIAVLLKPQAHLLSFDLCSQPEGLEAYWAWARLKGKSTEELRDMQARIATNFHLVDFNRLYDLMNDAGLELGNAYFQCVNFTGYLCQRNDASLHR